MEFTCTRECNFVARTHPVYEEVLESLVGLVHFDDVFGKLAASVVEGQGEVGVGVAVGERRVTRRRVVGRSRVFSQTGNR